MYSVLIVDDEEFILKAMQRIFRGHEDIDAEYYTSPIEALRRCQTTVFDVIVSDYRMPEMNGVDFLIQTKLVQPNAMRLILSAHVDMASLMKALNEAGIVRYITKPWDNQELITAVYDALQQRAALLENRIMSDTIRDAR